MTGGNATVSTTEIVTAALGPYLPGLPAHRHLYLMTCTPLGCEFDFSVRAEHYIPEVVVTAYPFLGNTSWPESNGFARSHRVCGGRRCQRRRWRDRARAGAQIQKQRCDRLCLGVADYWLLAAASTEALPFCTPLTYPMTPYFVSSFDPAWRDPTVEAGLSLLHVFERVGRGAATFASLYPRHGFVTQGHDYKVR